MLLQARVTGTSSVAHRVTEDELGIVLAILGRTRGPGSRRGQQREPFAQAQRACDGAPLVPPITRDDLGRKRLAHRRPVAPWTTLRSWSMLPRKLSRERADNVLVAGADGGGATCAASSRRVAAISLKGRCRLPRTMSPTLEVGLELGVVDDDADVSQPPRHSPPATRRSSARRTGRSASSFRPGRPFLRLRARRQ